MKLQILHFHLLWALLVHTSGGSNFSVEDSNCCNKLKTLPSKRQSTLLPIVGRVFSRKKRFLLLPPGGNIKFTANFSKRLLSMYPRGMSFAYEAATYYESITKRSDWVPKALRPRTTTTPKPAGPTKPIYVYIPGTEIRYKAMPAPKPMKVQRIDDDGAAAAAVRSVVVNAKYNNPAYWSKYAKYGKYNWTPVRQYNYPLAPHAAKWAQRTSQPSSQRRYWSTLQENKSYHQPQYMDSKDLRLYHGHRERRHLFRSLEGFGSIFGVNMTACILRTICDCERLLMPPGYSMLQDMIRVVFTLPMHHSNNDEYGHAMSGNVAVCEQEFSQKCPISLITWFLHPEKTI